MPETTEIIVARIDERLVAVERDVKEIKAAQSVQTATRPSWPAVASSIAALGALIITLIQLI